MECKIGLDFINGSGKRSTSFQLMDVGKAVATAEFIDGKLSSHRALPLVDLPRFWAECSALLAATPTPEHAHAPTSEHIPSLVVTPAYRTYYYVGGAK